MRRTSIRSIYYDFDLSAPVLVCFAAFLVYMCILIRKPDWVHIQKYGIPAFAMLACFGAAEEYKLFSGGSYLLHGFLMITLIILLIIESAGIVWQCIIRNRQANPHHFIPKHLPELVMTVLSVVVLISLYEMKPSVQNGTYSPELGGYLNQCADDLETSLEIAGNSRVFSAYASALEVATGQYQPTGTDYIIHCLTDETRQHYLDVFRQQNFEVVSTIRLNYSSYGRWIRNANWFFYREVYGNYHMVGSNSYADYWKPGALTESRYSGTITVQSARIDDSTVRISVNAKEPVSGIADVFLRCRSERRKGKASFLLRQQIIGVRPQILEKGVMNEWALRAASQEYIPIQIQNGTGSVDLTVYPLHSAELYIDEVSCENVFLEEYLSCDTDDEVTDE